MTIALKNSGVIVEQKDNSLKIKGSNSQVGGSFVKTFNDHRIAMSMLVFGLASEKNIIIDDERMIKTSFPDFQKVLTQLEQKLSLYQNKYPVIAIDGTACSGKGTWQKNYLEFLDLIILIVASYIEFMLMNF